MRDWRRAGRERLGPEHKRRDAARHAAAYLLRKGDIKRKPCEVCGSTAGLEMHHDDYNDVGRVRWFCKRHHAELPKDSLLPDRAERRPL